MLGFKLFIGVSGSREIRETRTAWLQMRMAVLQYAAHCASRIIIVVSTVRSAFRCAALCWILLSIWRIQTNICRVLTSVVYRNFVDEQGQLAEVSKDYDNTCINTNSPPRLIAMFWCTQRHPTPIKAPRSFGTTIESKTSSRKRTGCTKNKGAWM